MVFVATAVVTVILVLILLMSARLWITQPPEVVTTVGRLRLPAWAPPYLGALKLAGAAGVLAGLWLEALGLVAAAALVAYFVGAVLAHLRVGDGRNVWQPAVPLVMSVAALVLRIATM
jgi:hypothetical protein